MYYVAWMDILISAVKGLQYYRPEEKLWGQAHILASWAIFSVIREKDKSIMSFEFTKKDDKDYFWIHFDREKIKTLGFEALKAFLRKLHIYKSMGDYESAKKFFDHYSEVDEEMLKVREIVIANKIPRRLELQPNISKKEGDVLYKDYEETFEGVVTSFVERWEEDFMMDVYKQWSADAEALRRI